jgi:hypothetical protein
LRRKNCLWVVCLQYERGRQVEDAAGALDGRPDGSRVQKVHLEQPEARARAAAQGLQVLRLALILCKGGNKSVKNKKLISLHFMIWSTEQMEHVTEVLDGGVDGVAAVEEVADEPRADEAAAARHADEVTVGRRRATDVPIRRHLDGSTATCRC